MLEAIFGDDPYSKKTGDGSTSLPHLLRLRTNLSIFRRPSKETGLIIFFSYLLIPREQVVFIPILSTRSM